MTTKRARAPHPRTAIMAAAEELFADRGYEGTTIRDICKKADVNIALPNYYFRSKQNLYQIILESATAEALAYLDGAVDQIGSNTQRLSQMIDACCDYIFSNQKLIRIINRELLSGGKRLNDAARDNISSCYVALRRVVLAGIRQGEFRSMDVDAATTLLVGMLISFVIARPVLRDFPLNDCHGRQVVRKFSAHTKRLFFDGVINH